MDNEVSEAETHRLQHAAAADDAEAADSPHTTTTQTPLSLHDAEQLLARVLALYEGGKLVAAFDAGRPLGPLAAWPGTKGRVLAGRLAGQLGARRTADALLLRAFRADRDSPLAAYYYTVVVLARCGAFAALEALRSFEFAALADRELASDWYGLAAHIYALLRDFATAEGHLDKAFELAPDDHYRWVERAELYELQDRYADALAAARRALQANPASVAAIGQTASLLVLLDRVPEALELLHGRLQEVESAPLAVQLAHLQHDAGDYAGALASLDLAERLAPLLDKSMREYLAQARCDAYLRCDDIERAVEQARLSSLPHYKAFVERVDSGNYERRRRQLAVGFVRQHHMTCAPATLTAISLYWSKPADHLEVAEEICYDGTPHASERRWAVEHGFVAREFRVTWESAQALIDRAVPFTLTTVQPSSAHLQAVIGYDALRGTLVIRDPTEPSQREFVGHSLFEWSAANGPRGMLLIPHDEAARIDGIELPDAELYDLLHQVQRALSEHRRDDALASCARLTEIAPGHRLALEARTSLANYDANEAEALEAIEGLLRLYPQDVCLRLQKAARVGELRAHTEYVDYLEAQVHAQTTDPMFQLRFAQALSGDAREAQRCIKLLKRVLRAMPYSAEALSTLADLQWQRGAYPWATQLYRLASTLQATYEGAAVSYFRAARQVRDEERALAYLRDRVACLGKLSSAPLITLFRCLDELERTAEAVQELNAALLDNPDDAQLALFAAGTLASLSDFARAWPLLAQAEQGSRRLDWLRTAAGVHRCAGDLPAALAVSRELAERAPLDLDAQRGYARLLDELESRAAAIAHLRSAVARFSHHAGLNNLLVQWLGDEPLEVQETALRDLLQILPADAWARRELAVVLARQQRFDESYAEIEQARALAPASESYQTCLGAIHTLRGDHAAARSAYRAALAVSVDSDFALQRLLDACSSREERRAQLSYVYDELKRQVTRGEGMLAFQSVARHSYEPDELLAILREGLDARPDLWHAWIAVVRQLISMSRLDEAAALCEQTLERFGLLPRVHLERAEIRRLQGDREGEREVLNEAVRLSPGWALAYLRLSDSFEADGLLSESRASIERAVRHTPTDPYLHGYLADVLWRQGEKQLAIEHLQRALRLDPGYEWAWNSLRACSENSEAPELAVTLARELTVARATEPRVWLALALVAPDVQERLRATEQAVLLAPLSVRAHRRRIELLVDLRRFDDALAALEQTKWGEALPIELRAERARVIAVQGDLHAAIDAMRVVLGDDARYSEGWSLIGEWYSELGDTLNYLEAARTLHQLSPNDPTALGCLADAHRKQGAGTDVRPWLRRALELKPRLCVGGLRTVRSRAAGGRFRCSRLRSGIAQSAQPVAENARARGHVACATRGQARGVGLLPRAAAAG